MAAQTIEAALVARLRALPEAKQQQVLAFASSLAASSLPRPKLKNARGLWKGLGISISAEDIAEARKEMWGNFPREQFFQ